MSSLRLAFASCLTAVLVGGCGGASQEGARATSLGGETATTAAPVARTIDQAALARAINEVDGGGTVDRVRVPLSETYPMRGAENALVTIVEFSDFQCPFCSRAASTMREILAQYPTTVRLVYVHNPLPFHPFARDAARASVEAFRQGGATKFFQLHDLMFDNQRELEHADLIRYARQVGLDADAMQRVLDTDTHDDVVQAQMDLAANTHAFGTPMFYVNGRLLSGAQPAEEFVPVIDDEIRRAQAALAAGVAQTDLYAVIMERAHAAEDGEGEGEADDAPAPSPRRVPDPSARYAMPLGNGPTRGPDNALVTMVMFSDFECPFCQRVEPTVTELLQRYGNDLRVVWRNNPLAFHQRAEPAAQAAMAAHAQGKFWQMHDLLVQNRENLSDDDLLRFARQLRLNVGAVRRAIDTHEFRTQIEGDQAVATQFGARGTPAFFINGRHVSGAQPIDTFVRVIDEELANARQLVANGTARAAVYAAVTANGATGPQTIDGPAVPERREPDPNQVYTLAIPTDAPRRGGAHARVVIQVFSDFQCPFCGRVENTLNDLRTEFGDRVQFVWRNYPLPFHPNAMPAAEAATEVHAQGGAAKFWAFHDLLFQNQQALDRADLERYAQQVGGINMTRFRRALDGHTHQAAIEADSRAVQAVLGSLGTPSFLINGRFLQGAQPIESFRTAINAALAAPAP